jgi:general stress protein 26
MTDLQQRIFDILRPSQLASFATVMAGGKPWVRYVICEGREDLSIRFATFVNSRKVQQINLHPEVHLTCGVNAPTFMWPYLQVQGRAELARTRAERQGCWKVSLASYFTGPDDPNYGIVIIKPYRIELCSPGSISPEVWEAGPSAGIAVPD